MCIRDREEATELKAAVDTSLVDELKPAYDRLIGWFSDDQNSADAEARGVSALPNGEAYYNRLLASFTTTELTADEIHDIGLTEVARLRAQMDEVRKQVGFDGDLNQFFEFVREDDQFFFPNDDEGRQAYMDTVEEHLAFINERLPEYFGILPKAELVVKRVEPYREQDGAAQHYSRARPTARAPASTTCISPT